MPSPQRSLAVVAAALALAPAMARASFLSGDALDTMANVISWVVIIFVPLGVIALFWMVHVMPEKIAEKRHHPQQESIKVLCLLSLVFGGLLWPFAWLWAYTKPIGYRIAYGTEKHEDYFLHMAGRAGRGELDEVQLERFREEFAAMAATGPVPEKLRGVKAILASAKPAVNPPPAPAPSGRAA